MKTYAFFVGGSAGKGDTWSYDLDVELTDEEAERLEASARKEPRWRLEEDPEIEDIYDKVYEAMMENEIKNVPDDLLGEEIDDFLSDNDNWEDPEYSEEEGCWIKKTIPMTERELAIRYLDNLTFNVCYPRDLQDLEGE